MSGRRARDHWGEGNMPWRLFPLFLLGLCTLVPANAQTGETPGHYLFVWTGDEAEQGNDFMLVIDADPASHTFGRAVASAETDQRSASTHHTEYVMSNSGMLFANDHDANRTFIFNLRDPLRPRVAASFT